jgi:hypothetical protein
MKTHIRLYFNDYLTVGFVLFLLSLTICMQALPVNPVSVNEDLEKYTEYKGVIVDRKTGTPLAFANLMVVGTNVSTVTNTDGEFSIKISKALQNPTVSASFIGYTSKILPVSKLNPDKNRIELELTSVVLPEINVISKDAEALIIAVMEKKGRNYMDESTFMTAFYRETIKKNRTYVSLSEAVVEINKQPYTSYKSDIVKLYKARKKADYSKLDTITFKLQGGPFNSLYLDVMKNPDIVFTEEMIKNYEFSFDRSTHMDNQLIYVLDFKQRSDITEPLYNGKLYIDAKNLALKSAVFKLDISNRDEAARMFIVKKPFNAKVYPIEANYRIDYREKNDKWYYSYSRIEFGLKINWKKKLFNTNYFSTLEMAVTDWVSNKENLTISPKERIRPSVIISDAASGFADPEFWGEYNVIEPEKPIETAIKKIQKQLEKK